MNFARVLCLSTFLLGATAVSQAPQPVRTIKLGSTVVAAMDFKKNGEFVAIGVDSPLNASRFVRITEKGKEVFAPSTCDGGATIFSADTERAVTACDEGETSDLLLWNTANGQPIKRLALDNKIMELKFTKDRAAVLLTTQHAVHLLTLPDLQATRVFKKSSFDLSAAALSPDGRSLVAGDDEGNLYVWDATTGQLRQQWKGLETLVSAIAIAEDGDTFAVGDYHGLLKVGRLKSDPTKPDHLGSYEGMIANLQFTDANTLLVGDDVSIDVLDFKANKTLKSFGGFPEAPLHMSLRSDGLLAVSYNSYDEPIEIRFFQTR